jgi:uncharacterized protein (TIGR03067 family)
MKSWLFAALAAGLLLVPAAPAQDEAKNKDLKALEGTWTVTSVERDGKEDKALSGATRVHSGTRYTLTPKNGTAVPGMFKIDPGQSPRTIDMTPTAGRYKGKTLLGIYKLEGDTLTICFAEPGKDRPTEFVSKPGTGWVLAVHQRGKP